MEPQNISQQQAAPVSTLPETTPAPASRIPPPKKSSKLFWIIAGIVVLCAGVGIGILLRHNP